MVAIVSGNGLGLYNSSLNLLGSGTGGQPGLGRLGEQLYVNSTTGNLVIQQQDEYIPAQGLDLSILRTYNSQGRLDDDNGDNWRLGVYRRLTGETGTRNSAGATITRVGEDGAETVFTYNTTLGVYRSTDGDGAHDTLSFNTGTGQWTYTDGSNRDTETYNSVGQLASVADRDGTVTTYTYSGNLITQISQTGSTGIVQTLYLDYNASNQLTQVRALNNGVTQTRVRYSYDSSSRLEKVIVDLSPGDNLTADGRVYTTTYTYNGSSTRIASITQGDGTRMSFTYVPVGSTYKVETLTDGLNRTTRFTYVSATQTDVTDPLGLVTSYYNDASNRLAEIRGPAVNGVRPSTFYQYDADSNLTRVIDAQGNAVVYQYDTNGNATLVRDAAGNTSTRTYSTTNQLLTETVYVTPDPDAAGPQLPANPQTTRYAYDGEHHLRFVISAEGRVSEYQYNTPGKRTASIQYLAGTYSVSGLSPTTALTEAQLTTWVGLQDKTQTQRTNYSYEFHGLINTQTTFAKVDASGVGIADGSETRTSEWYQSNGDHWLRFEANGTVIYEYFDGLGRRTMAGRSGAGVDQATRIAYDDANNRIITTQADGLVVTTVYNAAGELVSRIEGSATATLSSTSYAYDANGRLRHSTDALGQRSYYLYDEAGRQILGIDATGALSEKVYNKNGQVAKTIAYATRISSAQLATLVNADGTPATLGTVAINALRTAADTVAERRVTYRIYDAANRLADQVDEEGYVTRTQYDGASRITAVTRYNIPVTTTTWPATPTLANITVTQDANGDRRTRMFYDADGRLLGTLDAEGYLSENQYNVGAQLTATVRYARAAEVVGNAAATTTLRTTGSFTALQQNITTAGVNAADQITRHFYNGKGLQIALLDAEGYLTEYTYDLSGNRTEAKRWANRANAYSAGMTPATLRPAASNPSDPTQVQDQVSRYTYDVANRLQSETDPAGTVTVYQYDQGDRVVKVTRGLEVVTDPAGITQTYLDGSQRVGVLANGQLTTYDYDANNQLVRERLHAIPAQAATWSQDFSANSNGLTSLTSPYIQRSGNRLWVTTQNVATTTDVSVTGTTSYTMSQNMVFRAEITTSVSSAGRYLAVGAQGTNANRQLTALFDGDKLYAAYYDASNVYRTTELSTATNPLKNNTAYVVEVVTNASSVTLYVYERGKDAATGVSYALGNASSWGSAKFLLQTRGSAGRVVNTNYVDNLSAATVRGRLLPGGLIAPENTSVTNKTYVYAQDDGTILGRTLADSRVTSYRYDLQGRLVAELTGKGNAYLESYLAINSSPSQTQIDSNWTNYGVKHSYDAAGRRTSTTDQLGHTTYFYYDETSRLRYVVTPADNGADLVNQGEVAEVQYSAFGEARFTRRFSGRISTVGLTGGLISQDFTDRLGTIVNPAADATTTTNYTLRGAIRQILDAESKVTAYSYNAFNEVYTETVTLDASKTRNTYYGYDRRGLMATATEIGLINGVFSQFRFSFNRQYDAFGRIISEVDSRGNERRFVYDRLGRTVTVTDPLNHSRSTSYDAFGRVLTQTDALNHTTSYRYSEADRSFTITTPEGVSTTTTRNRHGETVSISDGRGNTDTFVYDKNGKLTRHTNAAGEATTYLRDNADRLILTWDASFRFTSYSYDAANRVLTRNQGVGNINLTTSYRYDALGRTITVIDPNGVATKTEYDRKGQVKTVTVDPTSYVNAQGVTVSNQSGLNLVTAYSYNDVGHTLSVTQGSGTSDARITQYLYDTLGRRTSEIVDPGAGHLNLTTEYSYDVNNNVVAKTEGLGTAEVRTTRYVYDANNRLTYQVDATGAVVKTDYDNEGRVIRTSAYANTLNITVALMAAGYAASSIATMTADQLRSTLNSALTESTIAAGITANATTDRITWHAIDRDGREVYNLDAAGVLRERQFDGAGNVTQVTVFAEPLVAATIAALSLSQPDANKGLFEIHAAGRRTNVDNRVSRTVYDAADRPVFQIDGLNNVTEARYDGSGNVIATIAYARVITLPASLTTATLRTAVDAIANAATDHTTRTVYDAANRARYTIDALGYVTETQYDNVGRIKQTTAHYTAINTATLPSVPGEYDISTALTTRTNPQTAKDQVTRYDYDGAGRLTTVTQAATTPDQYTETYAYDAVGQTLRHTNGRNHSEYFAYDTAGRVKRHIDYAGYVVDSSYNALGERTTQTTSMNAVALPTTANDRYAYTALNPTPNTDPVAGDRTTTYAYDKAGRLQFVTGPSISGQPGVNTYYAYDAFGNITYTVEALGRPELRVIFSVYNNLGQLTEQTTAYGAPEAATTRFGYDAFGNQKTYIDPRGVELAEQNTDWAKAERLRLGYTVGSGTTLRAKLVSELTGNEQTALRTLYTTTQDFDRLNRKTSVTDALGNRTQTQYDAFGNIVKVTDPNLNVGYFYYDARNRVTFQVDPEGYATQTVYDAIGNTTETVKYANKVQGSYSETSRIPVVTTTPTSGPYLLIDSVHDQHTLAEYDVLNRTSKITDAESHFETFQYDAQGNVTVHVDKNNSNSTFTYDYDAKGNRIAEYLPITSVNGSNQQVQVVNRYEYDAIGNKTISIEAYGLPEHRVTQYIYDKNGRLTKTIEPQVLVGQEVANVGTGTILPAPGGPVTATFATVGVGNDLVITASWPRIEGFGNGKIRVSIGLPYRGYFVYNGVGYSYDGAGYQITATGQYLSESPFTQYLDSTAVSTSFYISIQSLDFINDKINDPNSHTYYISFQIQKQTNTNYITVASKFADHAWTAPMSSPSGNYNFSINQSFPSYIHFTGQPATGQTLKLSYWPTANPNDITEVSAGRSPDEAGRFSAITPVALAGDYGYEAKVVDAQGEVVNHLAGTFSVVNGVISSTILAKPLYAGALQTPITARTYDPHGNLLTETDAKGYVTHHYYDSNSRLTGTVDAEGYLRRYYYNAAGNKIAERIYADRVTSGTNLDTLPDPSVILGMDATRYRETTYRYNANNLLVESATRPVVTYDVVHGLQTSQSLVTRTTYDASGKVVAITDPNGNIQRFYYDKAGHRIAQVDPLGYVTAWAVDAEGNILSETRYASALSAATLAGLTSVSNPAVFTAEAAAGTKSADDRITTYAYDKVNRRTQETLLGAGYVSLDDPASGALTTHAGAAISTAYEYDHLTNITARIANGARIDYLYDDLGRKIQEQGPSFTDADGAVVRSTTVTVYDGVGNVKSVTRKGKVSAEDQVTRYDYDAHGHLIKETDPLGGPTTYYYDLNGNITVKHSRRTNPDGTAPAIDTLYTYDQHNQQLSTTDAKNFTYKATYNAYGEVIYKGLNDLPQQEYYEYDNAGRLIKTNKDDGVNRAYLYDANGNETARIQSADVDTDLEPLTITEIASKDLTLVQVTQSVYDKRNQLTETRQAPITFTSESVALQPVVEHVWVNGMPGGVNDPYLGGTILPAPGGPVTATFATVGVGNDLVITASWPRIEGFGNGKIRVSIGLPYRGYFVYNGVGYSYDGAGYQITATGQYLSESPFTQYLDSTAVSTSFYISIQSLDFINDKINDPNSHTYYISFQIQKQTNTNYITVASKFADHAWTAPMSSPSGNYNFSINQSFPSYIHFTGQPSDATALRLWLWPEGQTKPTAYMSTSKQEAGHFSFDASAYSGNYEYEFETINALGQVVGHVKGNVVLGANPEVTNKFVDQLQAIPVAGSLIAGASTTINIIRTQLHNAFGEITQETDGRGYATNFVYDKHGHLIEKLDPEVDVTLEDATIVPRQRPTTRYFYDYLGRSAGLQDANRNITAQRYDDAGNLVSEHHGYLTNAGSYVEKNSQHFGFNVLGNRLYADNEFNKRTHYLYDKKNRLIRVDRPTDASFIVTPRNPSAPAIIGNPPLGSGGALRFEEYSYDEADRRIKHTNALGYSELTYYDDIGRVKQVTSYEGIVTRYRYIYDAATGGTTAITQQDDGKTLEDTKNYFGKLLRHKDLGGRTFNYIYNLAGWLTHQTGDTDLTKAGLEQNIDFKYYHNGYLSDVIDYGVNSHARYEYDKNGNRTFEGYYSASGDPVYYQWTTAKYDALNRVTNLDDPKYNLTYEYDANGNRRHVYASYHDGLGGNREYQDYWYTYDHMNRFLTTKGAYSGTVVNADGSHSWNRSSTGTISAGSEGYAITYNDAGERTTANNETYVYAADGLLKEVQIRDTETGVNVVRARRFYDAVGNMKEYFEYGTDGTTITRHLVYTYTADGRTKTEAETAGGTSSTYEYSPSGILNTITTNQPGGTTLTTKYAYEYWDSAKQKEIRLGANNPAAPNWAPGFSDFTYDVNGHLTAVKDYGKDGAVNTGDDRYLSYKLDANGLILQRNELRGTQSSRTQNYYYLNGIGVGDAGGFGASRNDYVALLVSRGERADRSGKPVSSADFDYNYQPINDQYPATTPGTYSARNGDTLETVALAVWGDSSLWYLIADANGIDKITALVANQSLVIPNVVANVHNNASTFKVYNPGKLIGDTTPTLPDAPPPPISRADAGCGVIGQIIVIIITIVVAIFATEFLESLGPLWSAAFGAAAGSVAGQVTAMALGMQEEFDWGAVAIAGLTAGITKYIGSTGYSPVVDAVAKNAVGQGVNMLAGRQEQFSWASLATAAIAAPVTQMVGSKLNLPANSVSMNGASFSGFAGDFTTGLVSGAVTQGISILVNKGGRIDWANVAGEALGNAIGQAALADMQQATRFQMTKTKLQGLVGERAITPEQMNAIMAKNSTAAVDRDLQDLASDLGKRVGKDPAATAQWEKLLETFGKGIKVQTLVPEDARGYFDNDVYDAENHTILDKDKFWGIVGKHDLVRSITISGVMNTDVSAAEMGQQVANKSGSITRHIYNTSDGLIDFVSSVAENVGVGDHRVYTDLSGSLLNQEVRDAIEFNQAVRGKDATVTVIGHSQGTIIANHAVGSLDLLTRKQVDLVNVATATPWIPDNVHSYTGFINPLDVIPYVSGGIFTAFRSDVHWTPFFNVFDGGNNHGVKGYFKQEDLRRGMHWNGVSTHSNALDPQWRDYGKHYALA